MNLLTSLANYWPIIISVLGLGATWITMQNVDKDHEKRISVLETKHDSQGPVLIDIRERLASIETALKYLTQKE